MFTMPCISCNTLNDGICIGRCSPPRENMMEYLRTIVPKDLIPKLENEEDIFIANLYYKATNSTKKNENENEFSP